MQVTSITLPIKFGEYAFMASLIDSEKGPIHRSLVVNEAIKKEAQNLITIANAQSRDADATDALYLACGPITYASEVGQNAKNRADQARRRLAVLSFILNTKIGECCGSYVEVSEWRDLLVYFCRPLSIGSVEA